MLLLVVEFTLGVFRKGRCFAHTDVECVADFGDCSVGTAILSGMVIGLGAAVVSMCVVQWTTNYSQSGIMTDNTST